MLTPVIRSGRVCMWQESGVRHWILCCGEWQESGFSHLKTFSNLKYFKRKFFNFCTSNVICKDNVVIQHITVQHYKGSFPSTLIGPYFASTNKIRCPNWGRDYNWVYTYTYMRMYAHTNKSMHAFAYNFIFDFKIKQYSGVHYGLISNFSNKNEISWKFFEPP
jgi:hypothetical protein